jgi:hypothetical protein
MFKFPSHVLSRVNRSSLRAPSALVVPLNPLRDVVRHARMTANVLMWNVPYQSAVPAGNFRRAIH